MTVVKKGLHSSGYPSRLPWAQTLAPLDLETCPRTFRQEACSSVLKVGKRQQLMVYGSSALLFAAGVGSFLAAADTANGTA